MNFAILPVTKWSTWNETAPTATALLLHVTSVSVSHITRAGLSRVCVWLANLQPDAQKSFLQLFGQPRTRSKTTDEESDLFLGDQEESSGNSKHTNRIGGEASAEVIPDGIHDGLNRGFKESGNFCTICAKVWLPIHQYGGCEPTQSASTCQP